MATLKDVARLAKVDPSTVSRVLHGGNASVGDETRTRILEAAESLQYRANAAARTLRTRLSGALGLIIPDFENPAYGQIIEGAEGAARRRGFGILLLNAGDDPDPEAYLATILEGRLDGLIVANAGLHDDFVAQLERRHLPYILVNRRTEGDAPYVVADDAEAARLGVAHLIELGHREIGYLAGPLGLATAMTRREGARRAYGATGRDPDALPVVECDYSGEGVAEGVERLLREHPGITALAGANFLITMAAIRALNSLGRRVPEDVSVVGQDDTPLARFCVPAITTVGTPLGLIGARAADLLIDRLEGQAIESQIVTDPPPFLVLRESTALPPTLL